MSFGTFIRRLLGLTDAVEDIRYAARALAENSVREVATGAAPPQYEDARKFFGRRARVYYLRTEDARAKMLEETIDLTFTDLRGNLVLEFTNERLTAVSRAGERVTYPQPPQELAPYADQILGKVRLAAQGE